MSRPLMEHRHDYFNDAVRVCALTIDIRYESILATIVGVTEISVILDH